MHLIDQQLNLMIRGRFGEGWKLAEQMEANDPNDPRAKFNRGWFLINQGKLREGFQCLEYGRALKVYGSGKINTTKSIWNGEDDLTGKTVILNMECGFGDQIIYARYATEVWKRGGTAILCCEKSLHSIFNRIPGTHKCITLEEVSSTFHDYWIPGFSCSWLFGHTFENLPNQPYIFPKTESVELWKNLLNTKKIKVGIRWSGSPLFEHQQFRLFPAEKLINLYKDNEHIQFFSLQRDTDIRELPDEISDLQHLLISWEDTVACIQNLDLVITSCTSIAHIASAMGKPTWVIVPLLPYHIWANGDKHSPWYEDTTRVFRQTKFGKWNNTFEEVATELNILFPKSVEKDVK
jgi:hypothetical protein